MTTDEELLKKTLGDENYRKVMVISKKDKELGGRVELIYECMSLARQDEALTVFFEIESLIDKAKWDDYKKVLDKHFPKKECGVETK